MEKNEFWQIKCTVVKHILALPTQGPKCTGIESQAFEIGETEVEHPVRYTVQYISMRETAVPF